MTKKKFWVDAAERVIFTVAECALGIISGASMLGEIDWKFTCSACAVAGIITFLKCVVKETAEDKA